MRKNAIRFMLNDYPDVMSIDEMCRALSIGKKTGYKLLQTGQIRFLKIGRAYRIPKINLLEYLQVMLMCGKVTNDNLIDSSHYFRNTDQYEKLMWGFSYISFCLSKHFGEVMYLYLSY